MKLATVLMLAACSKAPANDTSKQAPQVPPAPDHVRSPDELAQQIHAFADKVHGGALPSAREPAFVPPPTDRELAWINDRSRPLDHRISVAMDINDDLRMIVHAYTDRDVAEGTAHPATAHDSFESVVLGEALVEAFAHLDDAMLDEFLPSVSRTDGKYQSRLAGLEQMEAGALEMMHGALITLQARRVPVAWRAGIVAVWRDHMDSYRKLWTAEDCKTIQSWLAPVVLTETDRGLTSALQELAARVQDCPGGRP